MSQIKSFRDVIDIWPSRESMATDTGAGAWAVSKWWQRNNIPSEWWASVLGTERARDMSITADVLTVLASREPAEAR